MGPGLSTARIVRVSGPLLEVEGLSTVAMADLVALGEAELPGEVVAISGETATVQAYEYTGGLRTGDPARALGRPLSVRLGPDLLGGVHDGLLRPLADAPAWLPPGSTREVAGGTWEWRPAVREGDLVEEGAVLGTVPTPAALEFRVLVPPGVRGAVTWLAAPGPRAATEPVAVVGEAAGAMAAHWAVRRARPTAARRSSDGAPLNKDHAFIIGICGQWFAPVPVHTALPQYSQQLASFLLPSP